MHLKIKTIARELLYFSGYIYVIACFKCKKYTYCVRVCIK